MVTDNNTNDGFTHPDFWVELCPMSTVQPEQATPVSIIKVMSLTESIMVSTNSRNSSGEVHYTLHSQQLGETALHVASYFGEMDVVQLLIEKGADTNALTPINKTPYD